MLKAGASGSTNERSCRIGKATNLSPAVHHSDSRPASTNTLFNRSNTRPTSSGHHQEAHVTASYFGPEAASSAGAAKRRVRTIGRVYVDHGSCRQLAQCTVRRMQFSDVFLRHRSDYRASWTDSRRVTALFWEWETCTMRAHLLGLRYVCTGTSGINLALHITIRPAIRPINLIGRLLADTQSHRPVSTTRYPNIPF